jgi:hypothetical protein
MLALWRGGLGEARKHADEIKAKFLSAEGYTIFKGPIMDNKGKAVITAGTDRGQKDPELEKMDYLVEGVIGADFMTTEAADPVEAVAVSPAADPGFLQRYGATIEYILIPGAALVGALAVFGIFVALFGKNPLDLYFYMYQGAFGTWFSWQNTLTRAAP